MSDTSNLVHFSLKQADIFNSKAIHNHITNYQ